MAVKWISTTLVVVTNSLQLTNTILLYWLKKNFDQWGVEVL